MANKKEISCGKVLTKHFSQLNAFTQESQKAELINFVSSIFDSNNVPRDYADEVINNLKKKNVKYGVIYLGDIVMAGMGMRASI